MSKEYLEKRVVLSPEGEEIHIDPLKDYYSQELPKEEHPSSCKVVEKFMNWARANSINVVAYGTGCGSIELRPLFSPRYDAMRFGISMRPTARQSNLIVVSGYCAVKTMKRIIKVYEQMPAPKYVVALGSCTINGGMYYDSYNTINRLDQYIPVDIYVAGCMPRPEALLAGFDKLKKRIKAGDAEGANEYAQKFEWYKSNQKKIIKDWDMPDYSW